MIDISTPAKRISPRRAGRSGGTRAARTARKLWDNVIVRAFLIVASLAFLFPLVWMITTALKSPADLAISPPELLPRDWTWGNFAEVFSYIPFARFFVNTLIVTVLTVLVTVVSNFLIAYGFACLDWRGRDGLFYTVLITLFLPFPLAIIPTFNLFSWLHWIDTFLPLIVPHAFGSAFFIFLLRQFLLQVPREYLDAARLDGASEWRIVWQIVFPLARPAVIAVAILAATKAWNEFLTPLLYLHSAENQTLAIGMQLFKSEFQTDIRFDLMMAASAMVIVPPVILFFLCQRYFIRGITLGAAK
ncbi:carbohydrate ABC transporter permease [Homoserinibacter sp. GY 40078]|uniref:carbohydrate ABC transporter permease n=1 Tax=Homoserinibacter sp. GY 40078 TaxID=2603275 RepID=UPI0011C9A224|nr:carbohydrate ABC transporter permease [Homoserinibacter sp. GY 40078]TXK16378.1 carbohydrate ABC transporter permease [Homoserinibacter sp. GY 40078]